MNKRLIARLLQARVPGLRNSGVYFFRGDFEYILTGAVLEYVPRGLYVWNFRFPLFDFSCPHLTFSDRLQVHPFIAKGEMSEEAIVDFILSSPEVRSAFGAAAPMSLPEFAEYLESDGMRNPHGRLIFVATLVLLGREARAAELLDELPAVLHPSDIPSCNRLRTTLWDGAEAARALLEQVRQENLRAFGVDVD